MPRLAVPAVALEVAQALEVLLDLGVDVALRERLPVLGSLDRRGLRGLGRDLGLDGRLHPGGGLAVRVIQCRPDNRGGDGSEGARMDLDRLRRVILLVDRARQAEHAGEVEDGICFEAAVLLGHAQDGELPAIQDALCVLGGEGLLELPARMQSAAGLDD